jgi:aspartyl-tRNA synthetase
MPTGSIEVVLKEFKIINPAKKQLPFVIRDFQKVMDLTDKYKLESSAVYCD